MRTLFVCMGAVVVTAGFAAAAVPDTIDLSSLDDVVGSQSPRDSVWDELSLEPVSSTQVGQQRFYVTGMLGESFATLAEPLYQEVSRGSAINRSVLTAGGAAGIAFERDNGRLRIEVEGRGRNFLCTLDSRYETIETIDQMAVRKADFTAQLVRFPERNFLKTIRDKLNWGADIRN